MGCEGFHGSGGPEVVALQNPTHCMALLVKGPYSSVAHINRPMVLPESKASFVELTWELVALSGGFSLVNAIGDEIAQPDKIGTSAMTSNLNRNRTQEGEVESRK